MLKILFLLVAFSQMCFAQTRSGGVGAVSSVNGQTGAVVIGTSDKYTFYGDSTNGNDSTCDGSILKKCKTITKLLTLVTDPSKQYALRLSAGQFTGEPTITWLKNVSIYGDGTNLNLDFTYTAASGDETAFVFDGVGINSFTMDLSAANVALPIFQNGSYSITRTDTTGGAHAITVRNSSAGSIDLMGNAIYQNVLFVGSATIQSGGNLLCTGCVWGISGDVYGTGAISFQVSTFVGAITGHTVGMDTPSVRLDASSNLGGTVTGAGVIFTDDAQYMAYTPDDANYWFSPPTTITEALDLIATGVFMDSSNNLAADLGNRNLRDAAGAGSFNWNARLMRDASAAVSLLWNTRELIESGGTSVLKWETQILTDPSDVNALSWVDRQLLDTTEAVVLDWELRQVLNPSAITLMDFSGDNPKFDQGTQLSTSGTQPTCDAAHRGLLWNVEGGAGVADLFQVCQKTVLDTYVWVTH